MKAEIKKIEPRLVITFGSEAKEYFDKIKEDFEKGGGRVINLLHPGQQNWDHWKQWIFEQAFAEKKRGGSDGFYTGIDNSISIRKWMFDDRKMDMPSIITDVIRELVSQTV